MQDATKFTEEMMMRFNLMKNIPTSRGEMERNVFIFGEKLREGKILFHSGLNHSIEGIKRVRRLPNSRIDLLSIDEMARLNANMMASFDSEPPTSQGNETS